MPVAVLADAHLGGPGGAAAPLVEQLLALPGAGCRHLVLLGDLFQVWIGDPRFDTTEVAAVTAALRELRERGVRLEYVEGNRDFFIGEGAYAALFDRVANETRFTSGGRRVLAVHGDGLNDRDRQYLFWRWLSKSAPVRLAVRAMPRALARRLVDRTERRLADTNFKHRVRIPEEAIRRWAATHLGRDCDLVLLGHFHEGRRWQLPGGEVWLLDAWFRSRRIELLPD
jgi:UDP-2,3-diacylglucosamine hydrolase